MEMLTNKLGEATTYRAFYENLLIQLRAELKKLGKCPLCNGKKKSQIKPCLACGPLPEPETILYRSPTPKWAA